MMADLQWKPIDNPFSSSTDSALATAKETVASVVNGKPLDGLLNVGSNYVTPQEYFSRNWADKFMGQQESMWNKYEELQRENQEQRDMFNQQRESWLNEKEQMINEMGRLVSSSSASTSDYRNANSTTSSEPSVQNEKFTPVMQAFYDTFTGQGGLSHNQAMAIMANIQAENSWADKYVFGSHMDGNKKAIGALSWQGGREVALIENLKKAGVYGANLTQEQMVKNAGIQAQHILNEMQGSQRSFMGNWRDRRDDSLESLTEEFSKRFARPFNDAKTQQGRRDNYKYFNKKYGFEPNQQQSKQPMKQTQPYVFGGESNGRTDYKQHKQGHFYNKNWNYGIGAGAVVDGTAFVSSGLGWRGDVKVQGASKNHMGYDLAVASGTKVYNPFEEAKVIKANHMDDNNGGIYMTIQDIKTGYFMQVLHNSKLNFNTGDTIKGRQVIALSGSTGAGGNHLDVRMWNKQGYAVLPDGTVTGYRHKSLGRG